MKKYKTANIITISATLCLITFLIIYSIRKSPKEWIEQHNNFNNHWVTNNEGGFPFRNAWVDTAGNTWVISSSGIIMYRQQGGNWTREKLPVTNRRLYYITGRGNEVWVTGEEGLILYKQQGQPWVQEQQNAGLVDLNAMFASGNEIWIVGNGGTILHKKNTSPWEVEECPEKNARLTGIKGAHGNLWIIGDDGIVLHKTTGNKWQKEDLPMHPTSDLTDLFVQPDQLWVTSVNGILLHKTDTTNWSPEEIPTDKDRLQNIFGWDNQVWVTTDKGLILYKKGNDAWRIESKHPRNGYFMSAWVQNHDSWLVGSHNVIFHKHENNPWVQEVTPSSQEILTTVAGNGEYIMAAGLNETILDRKAGGKWETTHKTIMDAPLNSIYATEEEAWIADNKGNILYKNRDNNWQKAPSPVPALEIRGGYRYGEDIWLIGEPAVILHKHSNGPWLKETPALAAGAKLNSIYGSNDEVWVAGTTNTLLHKKRGSTQWVNDYENKSVNHFYSVTAIDDELYALGSPTAILHKKSDQPGWIEDPINRQDIEDVRDGHFHAICKTDSGLYAVGGHGLLLFKKNQSNWMREKINIKGVDMKDIAVLDGTVWAIGNKDDKGVVLSKQPGKDWIKQEMPWTNFLKIINYKGLFLITKTGFLYKENDTKNFLIKNVATSLSSVVGAAVCNGQLYFAETNSIIHVQSDQRLYPTITRARFYNPSLLNTDNLEVQFTIQSPPKDKYKDLRQMRVQLLAKSFNNWLTYNDSYGNVLGSSRLIDSTVDSYTFAFRFEIADNFGITSASNVANKLVVKVLVSSDTEGVTEDITLKDKDGEQFFTISNDLWYNNRSRLIVLSLILLYLLLLTIWFFRPILFLKLYPLDLFIQLAALKTPFKQLLSLVDILFPMRLLAHSSHILDAWIKTNYDLLTQQFEKNSTVSSRLDYISLPLRMGNQLNGQLINEPDAAFGNELFQPKRTIVQVIGQGGTGKTMLAIAIGCWAKQPVPNDKAYAVIRIPVLIDSDTTDLLQSLKEWFNDCFGIQKVADEFILALLKKQRLLVIIDAFSERSAATQEYIRNIHAQLPVNAMLITTRQEVKMQSNTYGRLYPTALDLESLVHFVTYFLEKEKDHPFKKYHEKISYANEIASLVKRQGKDIAITPLLVKLVIENSLRFMTASTPIEDVFNTIPDFIPQVFYDYLCNTAPKTEAHHVTIYQLVKVAEDMAVLSLDNDLIPRDFKEKDILPRLLADPQYRNSSPIEGLIGNGIITRRNVLGIFYLRFNLDTMAEYLGASSLYDRYRDAPDQLDAFIDKVHQLGPEAAGFKIAFAHVREYKMKHG